ncbi:hypothetical protein KKG56_12515 [bacterium]|nr:hypothetical protein [bacterium]
MQSSQGIVVDSSGNVYVVDAGIGAAGFPKVEKFDSDGNYLADGSWGSRGADPGNFISPQGIAIDSLGCIYVTDPGVNRVQKFTPSGSYTIGWGANGTATGMFDSPQGIAIDSWNYVFVVDSNNCRIQKFNSEGKFITTWGREGTETGQFSFPQGIMVGTDNAIFVLDAGNHRIQKFTATLFSVTNITPPEAPNNATVSVTVAGTGFLGQATVKLVKSGYADIIGTDTMVTNSSTITCTFDLQGKQFGTWSVVVYNPNGHLAIATLTTAFTINDPDPPTIGTCTTVDTDGDGFIDAIDVAFSEAINYSTVQFGDFRVDTLICGSWTTLGTQNDSCLRLFFQDGTLTTAATPTLNYTPGSLTDLSDNKLATTTATTIDKASPSLRLNYPSVNGFDNQDIRVEYFLSEAAAAITLRFTNAITTFVTAVGSLSASAGTRTATILGTDLNLTNGTYSVSLTAADLAGNLATSTPNLNWTYDIGTPILQLIKPNTAGSDNQEIEVSYLLSEDVAASSLRIIFQNNMGAATSTNFGSFTQGSKQATHTITIKGNDLGLQDGATYTVTLIADDLAGNHGTATPSTNWEYRTTPPSANLIAPKSDAYGSQTIRVEYTLMQDVDTIKLVFQHTGGENDPKKTWEADSILPETAGSYNVMIDGGDLYSDGGITDTDYLVNGAIYSVWLKMVDTAGNTGTSNTNTNWTYDTTKPSITMSKPAQDGFDNQTIAVEYTLSEPSTVTMLFIGTSTVHTVTTTLSAKGTTLGTSSITPALPDGVATFTVKLIAWDRAGNEAEPAVSSNWTYDTVIDAPILTLANGDTYTTSREISVSVGNDTPNVVRWIIGEDIIARPDETDSRWTESEPNDFNLSSGDGKKTVYIWIKDRAGNVNPTKVSDDIILDQNMPTIVLSQPAANTANNGSITVTYLLSEELATTTLKLVFGTKSVAATAFTGNQGTNTVRLDISTLGLMDWATYTLTLTGCDLSGNQGTSNSQTNWRYDITSPTIGIIKPAQGMADNQSIAVEYVLSEDINPSSLKISFACGTFTATAASIGTATKGTWTTTIFGNQLGLVDGSYTVTLSATDIAGNPATPAAVSNWIYDTQIGSITLSLPSGSYTNQAVITVQIGTLTPQELGTVSYLLSESSSSMPSEADSSWTTTKPAAYTLSAGDGVKTLYLWVKDYAGNVTQFPATTSIMLDTTRPVITLNKPVANGFGNGTITLSYFLFEDVKPASLLLTFVGTETFTMTSSLWSGTSGTHELLLNIASILYEGTYTVYLSVEDMAGNTNTSNIVGTWTYDITKPTGTLSMPASNGIDDQNIALRYTLSEDASSVKLKFTQVSGTSDGSSPHVVSARLTANKGDSGTITLSGSDLNNDQATTSNDILQSNAVYEIYLEIVDRAGNAGSSSVNTNWTYDSQAPVIKLTKPSTSGFDNDNIAVDYNLSEPVSIISLIFEGPSTVTVPSGSLTITNGDNRLILYGTALGLQKGTYSVRMEAEDMAGNKGVSGISTNWIYDNTIATPTIRLAEGATYTKTALVKMEITEDPDVVTWYDSETQKNTPIEESGYWNSKPSSFVLNSKDDGTKTVYVWVKDRAGNINGGTDTIILDTKPPVVTLIKPAQNGMDNGDIAVNYTVSESEGIASVTLTFTWTGGIYDCNHVVDVTSTTTTTLSGNGFHGKTGTESLINGAIYTVSLQAVDLAGNISIPASNINWRYDTIPPVVTLNKPETNGVDNQSAAINYILSEAIDPTTIRLIFTSGTTIHTVTSRFFTGNMDNNAVMLDGKALSLEGTDTTCSLLNGATYTVGMSCADWAGNAAQSGLAANWTYDDQIAAPTCKVYDQNSGDANIAVSAVVRVEIEAATETVCYLLSEVQTTQPAENASEWLSIKPTAFQLSVGNGTKTMYLWVKDRAGNISSPATASIKLDTTRDVTLPVISLISPSSSGVDNGSITVSYSLSEPCTSIDAMLVFGTHTGTVTNLTGNYGANSVVIDGSLFGLVNGQTYTVTLSMVDFAGNRGTSTPAVTNWLYDTQIDLPSFYLRDRLTQSVVYTNSAMVDVVIGSSSSDVIKWIISEEHSSSPAEDSGLWNSKPLVFSLSLGDGNKTVYLWCKDMAGNISGTASVITMDTTKPIITLNSPASSGIGNGSITLNYSLSENIGSGTLVLSFIRTGGATDTPHTCTIGNTAAGSYEMVLSGSSLNLKNGAVYAVRLEGCDLAGNSGQGTSINWQYDISIATPTITLNQGASHTKAATVAVSVGNDVEAIGWLIGTMSGKPDENDPRWLVEKPASLDLGPGEGTRSVYLWTRDAVGNVSGTATAGIVLDTISATIVLTMPSVGNQSIVATYSLSEDVATATISFAGNGQVVGTSLTNLACGTHTQGLLLELTDGSYTVFITAVDYAGNSCVSNSSSWQYDTIAPTIILNKPASNGVDNHSIAVSGTASEQLSSMMLVFCSGGVQVHTITCGVGTSTIDDSGLTQNATYTVQIIGTDTAGNVGSSNVVSNWRYDDEINTPTLTIGSVTDSAVISVVIESATDTVGWILSETQTTTPDEDSSQWVSAKPAAFQLSAGNNMKTVWLWVKDRAGNVSQPGTASIRLDNTLDHTPPIVTLITPSTDGVDNSSIRVIYYLSEPCQGAILTFGTITVPAGSLSGQYGTNTITLDGSSLGLNNGQTYTVLLSVSDMNNNRATSTNTNWTYDTEIASASFYLMDKITGSKVYTHRTWVDVSVREHLEATGWLISETLGTPTEEAVINSRPLEFTLSSVDGTKTVYLWAKDRAGNVSPAATASIILSSTMDTIPPTVNLISPAAGGVDTESIWLNYTISEDVSIMTLTFIRTGGMADGSHSCLLGTACLLAGQHDLMVSGKGMGLQNGAIYSVNLKATDAYGNLGQASNSNWQYDTLIATPTLTLSQGASCTKTSLVSVIVNNDVEAIGWLIGTTTGKPDAEDLRWIDEEPVAFDLGSVQGTRSVYLWTRDAVGNVSGTATASIVLDTIPAAMTLTMLPVSNQSIDVYYQTSEPAAAATLTFLSPNDANSPHTVLVSGVSGSITLNGADLSSDGQRTMYDYLRDGATYTVTLAVCDLAGNTSSTSTTWEYDNSVLTPQLTLGTYTATQTITVNISDDTDVTGYFVSETQATQPLLTDNWLSAKPSTITLSVGDGVKHIFVWVRDSVGNICPSPGQGTITMDTTKPQINLLKPEANHTDNQLVVSYSLSEDVATDTLTLIFSGATVTTGLSPRAGTHTLIPALTLPDGTYTVSLSASDIAGNTGITDTHANWRYDTSVGTAGLILRDQTTNSSTYTTSPVVRVEVSTEGAIWWLLSEMQTSKPKTDDTSWRDTLPTMFTLSSGDGTKTVYLWMRDEFGNISNRPVTARIMLSTYSDHQPPSITLKYPASGGTDNQDILVEYYLSEQALSESMRLVFGSITITAGLTANNGQNSITIDGSKWGLVQGSTYAVSLYASDYAGNAASVTNTNWVYDTVVGTPSITLNGGQEYTSSNIAAVNAACDPDVVSSIISETQKTKPSLLSDKWEAATPTAFALSSSDGTKTVYLWVMDRAGNINGSSQSLVLDTICPAMVLNLPVSNGFGNGSMTLGYYLSEDAASISVTLVRTGGKEDGTIRGTTTLPTTRGDNSVVLNGKSLGLTDGASYLITIKACDMAGNASFPASAANWTYDTTPPELRLVYPSNNGEVAPLAADNQDIWVEYWLSEDIQPGSIKLLFGTITISNGLSPKAGKQTLELNNPGLTDGATYTVRLEAMDLAGNSASAVSSNWKYDVSIGTPSLSLGGTFTTTQVVSVDIGTDTDVARWLLSESQTTSPESNDSRWLSSKPSAFYLSNGSGVKNVYLWVRDIAGNMSHCMKSISIDTEPPLITLSQPAADGFCGTQTILVSYSLSEDVASGTLRLSFIRSGGSYDGYSPHRIVLTDTSKGDHSFVNKYPLVDGAIYTVSLEGEDIAGNRAMMPANINWTYDLTIPIITLLKPSNNGCDNHDLEVVYVLSENVKPDSVKLMFDDKKATAALPYARGTNTANINIAGLSLTHGQTYAVTMQAEDMAGNLSATVTKTNWTYDDYIGTPSMVMATSTASRLVNVKIVDDDAVAWLLGEGKNAQSTDWRSTRPTAVYLSSAEAGVKQVDLWVRDEAGNINHTAATITLTTSTSAQLGISIQSPGSGDAASQTIRLRYTLEQPVDPDSLRLVFTYSAGINDPNSPHTVTNGLVASGGVHDVEIQGYDLNNDGNQTTYDQLVDGAVYSLRIEATAGTSNAAAQINNLRYDISPPMISLISPSTGGYGNATITVRYQASEPLAENSLQLVFYGGQGAQTATTLLSPQGDSYIKGNDLNNAGDTLINGATYTICIQASDLAGNKAAPVYANNWKYDTTIGTPSLSLSKCAAYTNSSVVTVDAGNDPDVAKWLLSETQKIMPAIDNPLWTNMPTAYSLSAGEGIKECWLWVQDRAGNINTSPANASIIMDTISPQITLNSPAANGAGKGTITVSYCLSEKAARGTLTFEPSGGGSDTTHEVTELTLYRGENMVKLNGASVGLKNGTIYTVSLDAIDFAGNIGIAAVNHNWKYDTFIVTPTLLLRDHLTNGTQCTGARLIRVEIGGDSEDVKWLINEDADAVKNKDLWQQDKPAYLTLGTTSGTHTVYLWMRDRAGNISDVVSAAISLDMETPSSPGTPTAAGQFFSGGTYTINWGISSAASGIEEYELQEYTGSRTPNADAWNRRAITCGTSATTFSFDGKKHGDSLWYRVRARNNVGGWSNYSGVSEEIIIAELFKPNATVSCSSTDGTASITIPPGVLTVDTYLIIGRDPLNNPRAVNPDVIRSANNKDDIDLSWDRVDDTMTEVNAYPTITGKRTICLHYPDVNQDGFVDNVPYQLDEFTLKVCYLDEITQQWKEVEGSTVDPIANTVSAQTEHFSTFVLRGIPLRPAAVLGSVRVYPNPYKPNSNPLHNTGIHFGGTAAPYEERLTENVTIKIFTVTGELVRVIEGKTTGEYIWYAKNDDGDEVSTGVYIYQITNQQAGNSFGKVAIVR